MKLTDDEEEGTRTVADEAQERRRSQRRTEAEDRTGLAMTGMVLFPCYEVMMMLLAR